GDRWISLPAMLTPRAGAAVAVLGKQILVVGGVGEDQSPVRAVEVYNTEEGRWRKRSSLREPLMGVAITVKAARWENATAHRPSPRPPWLVSKMLTVLVNLEPWWPPPCRRPPSRHSRPPTSHSTPQYDRLHGMAASGVQQRVSTSYTSNALMGRLH
ncbi:hypothetical protein CRUP_027578, partial [Coryphaenoides rupestris]